MTAYTLAATPPVLLLIAAWHDPALFLWFLAVAAFVVIAALAAAAYRFRAERDEAREADERAGRERDEYAEEARIATELTDRLRADLRDARPLQVVPAQRDGSEYEWPRIARVLDIEDGEQA